MISISDQQAAELAPVWARPEAFPPAPGGWGWMDAKGHRRDCQSLEELIEAIRGDSNGVVELVWTPDVARMIVPEELGGAEEAVMVGRKRRTQEDLLDAMDRVRRFSLILGGLSLYMLWQGWSRSGTAGAGLERFGYAVHAVTHSMSVGVALLMVLIFGLIPWYQARKQLGALSRGGGGGSDALVAGLRFDTWLAMQKAPVTRLLLVLIGVVGLVQCFSSNWLEAAGLLKSRYLGSGEWLGKGEWWRLFTAPFLHGNILHFLMNASALLYLGKRVEVFARWTHLPLVFLFSACIGGEASARFLAAPAVGASGGLMGLLGFLLIFEVLHSRLVPRAATRRLLGGVAATALIGLVGYRFIDNAAHVGGLIAGMVYAAIVFPKSASANRPGTTVTDRVAGIAALAALVAAAGFTVLKLIA